MLSSSGSLPTSPDQPTAAMSSSSGAASSASSLNAPNSSNVAAAASGSNSANTFGSTTGLSTATAGQVLVTQYNQVVGATPTSTGLGTLTPAVVATFAAQQAPALIVAANVAMPSGPTNLTPPPRVPLSGGDVQPAAEENAAPGLLGPALPPLGPPTANGPRDQALQEFARPKTPAAPSTPSTPIDSSIDRILERLRDLDDSQPVPPLDEGAELGPTKARETAEDATLLAKSDPAPWTTPVGQPVVGEDGTDHAARQVALASAAAIALAGMEWRTKSIRQRRAHRDRALRIDEIIYA